MGTRQMLLFWQDHSLELKIATMTLIGALMTRSFALVELLVPILINKHLQMQIDPYRAELILPIGPPRDV